MNSEAVDSLYITKFIESNRLSNEELSERYYQEMISWLDKFVSYFSCTKETSSYKHITYKRIYEVIKPIENAEFKIFINNLLILNILDDHFQACDLYSEDIIPVEKEWINHCILSQSYVNPFTEESISKEEFSKMISRYFSFTDEFKEYLKHDHS
ncbi:hypothetical protein AB0T70_11225 [Acinetobacter baumannii]|uniref:hypothetical protein n=1 Tax=Acinetobacter baumannii TaxID=470 RepID=UPI0002AED285|nr:hypothetical protein [Acinetobacter baumannii]ELW89273.1 hypothetical protein ACINAA014_1459 [Acinetobacter baumannii AA-014]MBD0074946.1 hypothetical protein [Acinetobacter baumannii]MBD0086122.1 hypothetical protein [Acinetobacter baumannii]MBD0095288.1 hypothetical protein [Acinetobacter baumannii]MBD0125478.1 hypothetical protein [Acinetobacter baumannii]